MIDDTRLVTWDARPFLKRLERAGFTAENLQRFDIPAESVEDSLTAVFQQILPENTPLGSACRLFLHGQTVSAPDALLLFGDTLGELAELGVLFAHEGRVHSAIALFPLQSGYYATDHRNRLEEGDPNYVMGIGKSSRLLTALVPLQPGTHVLDLACGAGWLALHARRAGAHATGTDLNPRALSYARFNAKLALEDTLPFQLGDLFVPVEGQTFDAIGVNPPFVLSPGGSQMYREVPQQEDSICARVLKESTSFLKPRGFFASVMNWGHRNDDDWPEQPLAWSPESGVRRWLFQINCLDPKRYALQWIRNDPSIPADRYEQELARWMAHFEAQGIERISSGFIVMQRCEAGEEWTRLDSRSFDELNAYCGEEVMRIFHNESWLQSEPDDDCLLTTRFHVPDGIRIEMQSELKEGWQARTIRLQSPCRLTYDGQVDEHLMRLLELCRQGKPPSTMAEELRQHPHFANHDPSSMVASFTRELVRFGLLEAL